MYEPGKVLIVGGGDPPLATAEIIDLTAATPAWRNTGSMAYARRQINATVLPDGRVLVTGGSSGAGFDNESSPVLAAEVWDPATERWTTLASMRTPRLYHSTALLLPDGRVLSAGGGRYGQAVNHLDAEIYSPPYLFRADGSPAQRPVITAAPASVVYGQTFTVETPDAASIAAVTWVRLGSVTHAFNMNQRLLHLSFSTTPGGLNIVAPASGGLAPPGHYMLFLLNDKGVPSVAKIMRID
jgi:hypothetical protein